MVESRQPPKSMLSGYIEPHFLCILSISPHGREILFRKISLLLTIRMENKQT
jgi:hypothetical protein